MVKFSSLEKISLYTNGLEAKKTILPHLFKETNIMPLHKLNNKNALSLPRKDNAHGIDMKMNGDQIPYLTPFSRNFIRKIHSPTSLNNKGHCFRKDVSGSHIISSCEAPYHIGQESELVEAQSLVFLEVALEVC